MKLLEFQGRDVYKFLNRVCSQKITPDLMRGCIAHLLSPKGKVLCTFGIILTSKPHTLFLETTDPAQELLKAELEKYVLMEDLRITPYPEVFATQDLTSIPSSLFQPLALCYTPSKTQTCLDHDPLTQHRVTKKIPLFPLDYDSHFSVIETDVIQGIHFNKGCYPGQETVSKTVFRGHAPSLLYWVRGSKSQIQKLVQGTSGVLTSTYDQGSVSQGFIRLPKGVDITAQSRICGVELSRHAFSAPLPK